MIVGDIMLKTTTWLFAGALALTMTALPALAEDAPLRLNDAWAALTDDQEPILTGAQFAALNSIAFQAAAAKACNEYAIDQDKFAGAIAEATSPAPADMPDEAVEEWKTAVLVRFGASYGLFLAEAFENTEAYCAGADEMKGDTDLANIWE